MCRLNVEMTDLHPFNFREKRLKVWIPGTVSMHCLYQFGHEPSRKVGSAGFEPAMGLFQMCFILNLKLSFSLSPYGKLKNVLE